MTPKEQEWICEIAALNSASNTVTIAKICWKEIHRLRISQLRRMAHTAWLRAGHSLNANLRRKRSQYDRFAAACLAEIERLRGMG